MNIKNEFKIPKNVSEARTMQLNLKNRVSLKNKFGDISEIRTVAGCDVSYLPERHSRAGSIDEKNIYAAIVVLDINTLKTLETVKIKHRRSFLFPYIPGYLSFREGPVLIEAFKKLDIEPDLVIFDGQGIAHPRGIGIASHMGVILDKPAIGCAKSLLYGSYDEPPPGLKGAYTFLKDPSCTIIGIVMRSKKNTNPIFISQGNKIGLDMCADVVFNCLTKYRVPEPLRLAHIGANDN